MLSNWGSAPSANGYGETEEPELTQDEKEEERQDLVYLKALRESSKAYTKKFMGDFHNAWGYVIGEKRFPAPTNKAAQKAQAHMARTVRNGMYAMMDHRVSFITDAEPRILMKTLQTIDEQERKKLESILESELDRLDWNGDAETTAWDSEVGSVGLTMFYLDKNELTGDREICSRVVDPSKVYVSPKADEKGIKSRRLLYMTFEDDMPLAEVRRMWPDEGHRVKATKTSICNPGDDAEEYVERDDDEIVSMPGNEFVVTKRGQVVDQTVTVTWAWEKWPETRQIWEERENITPKNGYFCPTCEVNYISDEPVCDECQSEMEPVTVPEGAKARQKFVEKVYPYGRCMIGIPEQGILLYKGTNEVPLERVFPFAMDQCYRKPRQFYGMGTYHQLKSNQQARDQNIGLLRDHLRYNAHPIFEYPQGAENYATAGNAPGTQVSVPDELSNKARNIPMGAFDYQGFSIAESTLEHDAQEITGVDEILTGGSPGPESGEAIKTRQVAKGKRIAGTLKRFNEYRTDYAAIVWEIMSKVYTTPRTFTVRGPQNELQAITETISQIPYDVIVQVTADPDKVETDRLMGQNLSQFIMSGAIFDPRLLPFMDFLLSGFGLDPSKAEIVQARLQQVHQQEMAMQQAQMEMQQELGLDPGSQISGMPPQEEAAYSGEPQPQMEGAMQ